MSDKTISKIHLSLTRAFRFYPQDESLKPTFSFFNNSSEYFNSAIKDTDYLGKQEDKYIPKLGKLRSVLDTQSTTIEPDKLSSNPDPFFCQFQDYYSQLSKKGLFLLPHYPCVVDILPNENTKYQTIISSFPGSLTDAKNVKLSVSMRIYPAGLAFLRFGLFFSTSKTFDIESITDFLWRKDGRVDIDGLRPGLTIDGVTKAYGRLLLDGLHSTRKTLSWEFTHSHIDVIESSHLEFEQNFYDFFWPLISLGKQPKTKLPISNLAKNGDVLLFGPESSLSYLPASPDAEKYMNADRRKVRRWIRNAIELFSTQRLVSNNINTMNVSMIFDQLRGENWLKTLKKGFIPPTINQLFSYWNYTNLHFQNYPLSRPDWKYRYAEILRILDEYQLISTANKQAMEQLLTVKEEAAKAKKEVGKGLGKLLDFLKNFLPNVGGKTS